METAESARNIYVLLCAELNSSRPTSSACGAKVIFQNVAQRRGYSDQRLGNAAL